MLALILKGLLKSITLSSLQRREINMFLKAKRAACGACVWPSLIQPEAFGGKLFLKKNYRVSRSNGFTANTISKFLTHMKKSVKWGYCVSKFGVLIIRRISASVWGAETPHLEGKSIVFWWRSYADTCELCGVASR